MTNPPVGVERRIGQRFPFNLPVSLRDLASATDGVGFTQDLSSRGAFLVTDMTLQEGAVVELTLKMPSEITLGENMRVRCRGIVLRIVRSSDHDSSSAALGEAKPGGIKPENRFGVAVCLKDYEYLSEAEDGSAAFRRISALHSPAETERAPVPMTPRVSAQ